MQHQITQLIVWTVTRPNGKPVRTTSKYDGSRLSKFDVTLTLASGERYQRRIVTADPPPIGLIQSMFNYQPGPFAGSRQPRLDGGGRAGEAIAACFGGSFWLCSWLVIHGD